MLCRGRLQLSLRFILKAKLYVSMKISHITTLVTIIVIIFVFGIITYKIVNSKITEKNNDASRALAGESNNPASYTDLLGNPVALNDYLGKILIVNVWASWSPFSEQELINLQQIATDYSEKSVAVLAINRKEEIPQVSRFVETLPDLSAITFVIDKTDNYYSAIGGYAMPETVIYNQKGTEVARIRGIVNIDNLKQKIDILLSG